VCTDAIGVVIRSYSSPANPHTGMYIQTSYNVPITEMGSDSRVKSPPVEVTVRGKQGSYVTWDSPQNKRPPLQESLSWTERPGVTIMLVRSGAAHSVDEMVKLAEGLRAEPLSFDVAPRVVASGELHNQPALNEPQRWYLSIGRWYGRGYCMTVSAFPAQDSAASPDGVVCADHLAPEALAVAQGVQGFDASSSVVAGTARTDVARLRMTRDGAPPVDVDVVGRDEGLGLGFWAVQVPNTANYSLVPLDASGNPIDGGMSFATSQGTPVVTPTVPVPVPTPTP
jgi:hypothetical protein